MPKVSQAHLDARRDEIVEAAMTCFARDGVERTTIQSICAQAGLSAGAIYRYFDSKEAILDAVFTRHAHAQEASIDALEGAPDPEAAFEAALRGMWFLLDDPDMGRDHRLAVVAQAVAMHDPAMAARYAAFHRRLVQMYAKLLGRDAAGDCVDVEAAVLLIDATYQGWRTLKLMDPELDTARFAATAAKALRGALGRPAPR